MNQPKKRIWELDFLRGLAIITMVCDHFMLCISYYFGPEWFPDTFIFITAGQYQAGAFEIIRALSSGAIIEGSGLLKFYWYAKWYWNCNLRAVIHPYVFSIFIGLCGLSCSFSKNNMKRGLILALVSYGFTLFMGLFFPEDIIRFGILHMLSVAILSWQFVSVLCRGNKIRTAYACLALFLVLLTISVSLRNSPEFLSSITPSSSFFKKILIDTGTCPIYNEGIYYRTTSFSPGDFFPLLPWLSVFYLGAGIGPLIYPNKKSLLPALDKSWNRPVCFCGRHTLIIYLGHQVVAFAVLMLLSYFFISPGNWVLFSLTI